MALFCAALYINSLNGEFVWDDQSFVVSNASIRDIGNFARFFLDNKTGAACPELASDTYRPLTTLSYAIDYAVWGLNSFGYHLTNVILHSANAILVCILLFLLSENFFIAFFGGLIFAAHPIQTEVVAWVSGRSSALFLLFYLSSLIFYIRYSRQKERRLYGISLALFALSLFSKEMSITLPFIIVLYDIYFPNREKFKTRLLKYIPYFALALFYVVLRIILVKKVGQFGGLKDPYYVFFVMSTVVIDYVRLLFVPLKLCAVGYPVPAAISIKEPRVIFSLISIVAILACVPALFRRHRLLSFAIAWFFITLLPVLNIIPIKALEAERFLYLPSIGFCILASCVMSMVGEKFGKPVMGRASIAILLSIALVIGYSTKTILRVRDWRNEITISEKTAEVSPDSVWVLTVLGTNLIERGDYASAIKPLEKAVALNGQYEPARSALGEGYLRLARYEDASVQLAQALKMEPLSMKSRNFLGVAYANLNRYDDARKQFTTVLKRNPRFLDAYLNLGRLYEMMGEYDKAIEQYRKILNDTYDDNYRAILFIRIGDAYLKMNSRQEAIGAYQSALSFAGKEPGPIRDLVTEKMNGL